MALPPNPAHFTPDALSYPLNINSRPILPSVKWTETSIELLAAASFHNTIFLRLADQDFSSSAGSETARAWVNSLQEDLVSNLFEPLDTDIATTSRITALPTTRTWESCVRLTDAENLQLAQLCVTQASHFERGKLMHFWKLISGLSMDKTKKELKDPCRLMEKLVDQRKLELKLQEKQSGILQEPTDLSNALDCLMTCFQNYQDA